MENQELQHFFEIFCINASKPQKLGQRPPRSTTSGAALQLGGEYMAIRRTDLALEAHQLRVEAGEHDLPGVISRESTRAGYAVTTVEVRSEQGAQALGKEVGRYVTLELDGLLRRETDAFPRAVEALAAELEALLPVKEGEPVLVVGLGNRAITPDLLGPLALEHTLVTRHLVTGAPEHFGSYRPVCAITPGVLSSTGMESAEIAAAVTSALQPACVVAVDALASRSLSRVCRTVQLSDTGITPGSGVGNHRSALTQASLGVPVLTVGVPTVVDGATLALDILAQAGREELDPDALAGKGADVFVTPREIDAQVADLAKVVGYALSMAFNPHLTVDDLMLLLE